MPMTTRTDMQNPRGTDYEHWKQPPTSPQPPRECKHEKSYEKNGVRYCDDCMKAWEVSRPHPQAPEQKSPICENCGLDNAKCQMDMAGCLQAQNEAARTATLKVLKPIKDIHERFKHLDAILSKRDPDCPMMMCYVDIWEAVKESLRTAAQEQPK
jgi:hypothetical protein